MTVSSAPPVLPRGRDYKNPLREARRGVLWKSSPFSLPEGTATYSIQRVHVLAFQPEGIGDAALHCAKPGQFVFNRWRCERVVGDLRRYPDQAHASAKRRGEI